MFVKLFVPTLLGMLFGAMLNIADGIFVGRGVRSDALAAVNIAAPIFLITTGVALMFGSGVSVVATVHLAHQNEKAARINVTQAITVGVAIITVMAVGVMLFPRQTAHLFGGTEQLMPYVLVIFIIPIFIFLPSAIGSTGLWIAMPLSELLTLGVIVASFMMTRRGARDKDNIQNTAALNEAYEL